MLLEIKFFILSLSIASYFSTKFSTVLNSAIKLEAVFMPTPGTPGTLSTLSPIRACTSITLSGVTPNFSCTLSISMKIFLIGSYIFMSSETSCIKSLSDEKIVTMAPSSVAFLARVAIMSSASYPFLSIAKKPNASVASLIN